MTKDLLLGFLLGSLVWTVGLLLLSWAAYRAKERRK